MATESWSALMAKAEVPQGPGGKLIPKGMYRVRVLKVKVTENVPGKKDKVSLSLEVQPDQLEAGEKFWDNLTVSPESPVALGIFFQTIERLGADLEVLKAGGKLAQAMKPVEGRIIDASVDVREWPKGQTPPSLRNQVGFYRVVTEGDPLPAQSVSDPAARADPAASSSDYPF